VKGGKYQKSGVQRTTQLLDDISFDEPASVLTMPQHFEGSQRIRHHKKNINFPVSVHDHYHLNLLHIITAMSIVPYPPKIKTNTTVLPYYCCHNIMIFLERQLHFLHSQHFQCCHLTKKPSSPLDIMMLWNMQKPLFICYRGTRHTAKMRGEEDGIFCRFLQRSISEWSV
jgi:hypothetical protein